MRDIGLL